MERDSKKTSRFDRKLAFPNAPASSSVRPVETRFFRVLFLYFVQTIQKKPASIPARRFHTLGDRTETSALVMRIPITAR